MAKEVKGPSSLKTWTFRRKGGVSEMGWEGKGGNSEMESTGVRVGVWGRRRTPCGGMEHEDTREMWRGGNSGRVGLGKSNGTSGAP